MGPPELEEGVTQGVRARRLHAKIPRAGRTGGRFVLGPIGLAHDEHGDRLQACVIVQAAQHRGRVHVGEMKIEDDERRPGGVLEGRTALEEGERLVARLGGVNQEAVVAEDGAAA